MIAAQKGELTFVSSEESAIRRVCHNPDTIWSPKGGEPVIVYIKGKEPKLHASGKISAENFLERLSGSSKSLAGILK